jgi:hypothetical protein
MSPGIDWLLRYVDELPQASPPLLLLVGMDMHLSAALHHLQTVTQAPSLSVGRELGLPLLELSPRERMRTVGRTFRALLRPYHQQMVLLDRTALLFLPELHLNPLQLLSDTSRTICPLVVAWPGQWDGKTLTYAYPGHPEYQRLVHPEALVVSIV